MSTSGQSANEAWGSRIGLILAMAGSAVGLGNFLRFPGQAAANGGGSFMIPYFIAFLVLGIPLMWIEWGIGRNGGRYRKGHMPGMLAAIWHHPAAKYLGVIGMVIPVLLLSYYTVIESWTLAFAWFSISGDYWDQRTPEAMAAYLGAYQTPSDHATRSRFNPNSSRKKATIGVAMATEDVMPAKKRSPNHIAPSTCPAGICWKTSGIVTKPRLKEPDCATAMAPLTPKNATAAGIAIEPPSTTSAASFVAAVASPESAMSSCDER